VTDPFLDLRQLVSIHQPNLFPRVTTLTKILLSNIYVPLTEVQFTQRDYQHRFRISDRLDHEQIRWLTVPVHLTNGQKTLLTDVQIVKPQMCAQHLFDTLRYHYGLTPGWDIATNCVLNVCKAIVSNDLVEANQISMNFMLELMDWPGTVIANATQPQCERSERLARITKSVRGNAYICGTGGRNYLKESTLKDAGIDVISIDYAGLQSVLGPSWKSRSSIDLLCLSGLDGFRSILQRCQMVLT
ncbi:unnamed protein product, partial [Acidithrix sp. C25]